ncbi:hypothetical protein J3F83DRAFT_729465 [Trichoderma novae-zelandiae]
MQARQKRQDKKRQEQAQAQDRACRVLVRVPAVSSSSMHFPFGGWVAATLEPGGGFVVIPTCRLVGICGLLFYGWHKGKYKRAIQFMEMPWHVRRTGGEERGLSRGF